MKRLRYYPLLITALLMALASCAKDPDAENTTREIPDQPDGITIDTTWSGDTTVYFNP